MNLPLFRLLLAPLLSIPLVAQQQPTAAPDTVTLDIVVADHSGKAIPGFTQSDFTVLDNGKPQKILSFSAIQGPATDPPTQVILLIDTVNNSIPNVAYEREQIATFLRRSGPTLSLPLSLIFFSDSGTQVQQAPSASTDVLLAGLKEMETKLHTIQRASGVYAEVERVNLSLKTAGQISVREQLIPGRKLLI